MYLKYVPTLNIIQCSCIWPHLWSRLRITFIWVVHSLSKWALPSTLVRNYPGIGSTITFHMQCFLFFILKKVLVAHFRVYNGTSICKDNSWYINWITNIVRILILLDCYDYGSATSYRIYCLHVLSYISEVESVSCTSCYQKIYFVWSPGMYNTSFCLCHHFHPPRK